MAKVAPSTFVQLTVVPETGHMLDGALQRRRNPAS
jgi:hypothetical protein